MVYEVSFKVLGVSNSGVRSHRLEEQGGNSTHPCQLFRQLVSSSQDDYPPPTPCNRITSVGKFASDPGQQGVFY